MTSSWRYTNFRLISEDMFLVFWHGSTNNVLFPQYCIEEATKLGPPQPCILSAEEEMDQFSFPASFQSQRNDFTPPCICQIVVVAAPSFLTCKPCVVDSTLTKVATSPVCPFYLQGTDGGIPRVFALLPTMMTALMVPRSHYNPEIQIFL